MKGKNNMLDKNKHSNLLEQSQYKYSLQDVDEPNLYREVYPYDEVPKVAFNHRRVPLSMPDEIWITDTTFRDGQQSRAPYTADQIVELYKKLHRLGGPKGIIRQSEFFVYTKKDREAMLRCMDLGYEFPQVTTWIRAKKRTLCWCVTLASRKRAFWFPARIIIYSKSLACQGERLLTIT